MDQSSIMRVLDWAYDKAIYGGGPFKTADELADNYLAQNRCEMSAANSLVNWQTAKCATSGFVTGLGGILTLPVAVPANISSVIFVQLRMIAAIAIMGGHDPVSDQVKSLAYICLTGSAANDILKTTGINIGSKLAQSAIKNISGTVIKEINKKVGFRLITKFGKKGAINLGKAIPIIGGAIGGSMDAVSTKIIGAQAKKVFLG